MIRTWRITAKVVYKGMRVMTLTTFIMSNFDTKEEVAEAGRKVILRMPGVMYVSHIEAVTDDKMYYDGMSADPEVS